MAGDRSGGVLPTYRTAAQKAVATKQANLAALKAEIAATPAPTMAQIGELAKYAEMPAEQGDSARGVNYLYNSKVQMAQAARPALDAAIAKAQAAGTFQLPKNYMGEMKWHGLTDPTSVANWTPEQKALQLVDPTIFESAWKQTTTPADMQRLAWVDAEVTKQRSKPDGMTQFMNVAIPVGLGLLAPGLGAALLGPGASSVATGALGGAITGGVSSAVTGGDPLKGAVLGGAGGAVSGYMSSPSGISSVTPTPYGANPAGTLSANEIASISTPEAFTAYQTAGMIPPGMSFNGGNILTSAGTSMVDVSSGGAGLNLPTVQSPDKVTFAASEPTPVTAPVSKTPLPPGGMTATGDVLPVDPLTGGTATVTTPTTAPTTATSGGILDLNNDGKVGLGDLVKGTSGAMTVVGAVGGITDALTGGGSSTVTPPASPYVPFVLKDAAGNRLGQAQSGVTATNVAPVYGGPEQVYFLNNSATNVSRPILPAAATGGLLSLGGNTVTPPGYAEGGMPSRGNGVVGLAPQLIRGSGDGMSDDVPAYIDGGEVREPIRVADGEYIVPADVVSHLGNGSTDAGAEALDELMARIRTSRTGKAAQAPKINTSKLLKAV